MVFKIQIRTGLLLLLRDSRFSPNAPPEFGGEWKGRGKDFDGAIMK
jgi:hypothetical protein